MLGLSPSSTQHFVLTLCTTVSGSQVSWEDPCARGQAHIFPVGQVSLSGTVHTHCMFMGQKGEWLDEPSPGRRHRAGCGWVTYLSGLSAQAQRGETVQQAPVGERDPATRAGKTHILPCLGKEPNKNGLSFIKVWSEPSTFCIVSHLFPISTK